jgi:hypothetical protein
MMQRKILVDALGTLRNTGIQVLNVAKDWVMPGTEFESEDLSLK